MNGVLTMSDRRRYTDTQKWCPKCEQWLLHAAFRRNKAKDSIDPRRPSGLQVYCKPCENAYRRERDRRPDVRAKRAAYKALYDSKPENRAREKDRQLRRKYGLTLDDFHTLLDEQAGVCGICSTTLSLHVHGAAANAIHVDHDHVSERVRGLLCAHCNRTLGLFGDDIPGVERALAYLRRHEERESHDDG